MYFMCPADGGGVEFGQLMTSRFGRRHWGGREELIELLDERKRNRWRCNYGVAFS